MNNKISSYEKHGDKYICPYCGGEYSEKGICTHVWRKHGEGKNHNPNIGYKNKTRVAWNKGQTKETNESVKKCAETYKKRVANGDITPYQLGKALSEEHKKKISESMKRAHKEGRAHNIGESRWNNQPSYPEIFFMNVIENEFCDKNYIREYGMGIYSIDFAWVDKKLAIEIDGEQHYRYAEYHNRDVRKDEFLVKNGWKVLRIKWVDMFHEPKKYIKIAKDFIEK